jgi:hypothetical protein
VKTKAPYGVAWVGQRRLFRLVARRRLEAISSAPSSFQSGMPEAAGLERRIKSKHRSAATSNSLFQTSILESILLRTTSLCCCSPVSLDSLAAKININGIFPTLKVLEPHRDLQYGRMLETEARLWRVDLFAMSAFPARLLYSLLSFPLPITTAASVYDVDLHFFLSAQLNTSVGSTYLVIEKATEFTSTVEPYPRSAKCSPGNNLPTVPTRQATDGTPSPGMGTPVVDKTRLSRSHLRPPYVKVSCAFIG